MRNSDPADTVLADALDSRQVVFSLLRRVFACYDPLPGPKFTGGSRFSHTGTVMANAVKTVVGHPMMAPVVHAFRATLALVRPVSQGLVANRLLAALVPVVWLRAVIAFLFMPLLVDSTVIGNVWDWANARPATPKSDDTEGTDDGDLLADTLSADQPIPSNANVPSDDVEQDAEDEEFPNRADRRVQQREDAHVKRMQRPRR